MFGVRVCVCVCVCLVFVWLVVCVQQRDVPLSQQPGGPRPEWTKGVGATVPCPAGDHRKLQGHPYDRGLGRIERVKRELTVEVRICRVSRPKYGLTFPPTFRRFWTSEKVL